MQWTDQIRRVKIFLVLAAVIIAVASLVVSHLLIRDLAKEEHNKMAVWAEAMRTLNNADENTDINLVLKVINGNNTIPVIVLDSNGDVQAYRNIDLKKCKTEADSVQRVEELGKEMLLERQVIRITLNEDADSVTRSDDYINVCYADSVMLRRLASYPYIQLGVVMIFVVIAIFALLTSKRAEQNKVWVGLSKETAHQLGTPISSLMAWQEILKESYPEDPLVAEMGKDVERLQLIADRFSKIGSLPEPVPSSLNDVIDHVIDYMDRRTSRKVSMVKELPKEVTDYQVNQCLNYYYTMANYYGYDLDSFLQTAAGYDSADALLENMSDSITQYAREALLYQAVAEAMDIAPTQEQLDAYSDYKDTYGQNYCTMVALMDAVTSTLTSGAVVS